jgi:hypothetical protein
MQSKFPPSFRDRQSDCDGQTLFTFRRLSQNWRLHSFLEDCFGGRWSISSILDFSTKQVSFVTKIELPYFSYSISCVGSVPFYCWSENTFTKIQHTVRTTVIILATPIKTDRQLSQIWQGGVNW